jgi:hypothetical protein
MTWVVSEVFAKEPKTAAMIERARARGHKVEITPGPPRHVIWFFGEPEE